MDLLFEIGTEELPASFQQPAVEWMAAQMDKALDDARLHGEGEGQRANIATYATPRRLTLVVTAIAERAPDLRRKLSGPPAKQALQDGKWTKAAEGFARKAGVSPDALNVEGDRGVVEQNLRGQTAIPRLGVPTPVSLPLPLPKRIKRRGLRREKCRRLATAVHCLK